MLIPNSDAMMGNKKHWHWHWHISRWIQQFDERDMETKIFNHWQVIANFTHENIRVDLCDDSRLSLSSSLSLLSLMLYICRMVDMRLLYAKSISSLLQWMRKYYHHSKGYGVSWIVGSRCQMLSNFVHTHLNQKSKLYERFQWFFRLS